MSCELPELLVDDNNIIIPLNTNEMILTDLCLELLQKGREYYNEINDDFTHMKMEADLKDILNSYISNYDFVKEYDIKVLDMNYGQYCIDIIPLTEKAFKEMCNIDKDYNKKYIWDNDLGRIPNNVSYEYDNVKWRKI